jgi:tRNA pseudouridine-54 N-methylase
MTPQGVGVGWRPWNVLCRVVSAAIFMAESPELEFLCLSSFVYSRKTSMNGHCIGRRNVDHRTMPANPDPAVGTGIVSNNRERVHLSSSVYRSNSCTSSVVIALFISG